MYTAYATFTINCAEGESGPSVTRGASAESVISQRDADLKALGLAQRLAYEFLVCEFPPDPEVPVYCSAPVSKSAASDPGYVPDTWTVDAAACAIYSLVSQADADAAAAVAVQLAANHQRDINQKLIFYNTPQTFSNTCNAYLGPDRQPGTVTITLAAGAVSSPTSQADADLLAFNEAKAEVIALLISTCIPIYRNAAVSYTATCTLPLVGTPVTVSILPATYISNVSQADADAMALAAATTAANSQITCFSGYYNVEQSVTLSCIGVYGANWYGADSTWTVPAGTFSAVSQLDADNAALASANEQAQERLACTWGGGYMP